MAKGSYEDNLGDSGKEMTNEEVEKLNKDQRQWAANREKRNKDDKK